MPHGVVFDAQVLQVAGWADRGVGRYAIGLLEALLPTGRLRAVTLRPELPPPSGLPPAIAATELLRWDDAGQARAVTAGGPVVRLVPAAFLHAGPRDPAGLVTAPHWAAAGTPRVVVLHDLIPLRAPRHYLGDGIGRRRYLARAAWASRARVVVTNSEHTRREAIDLLGCPPSRVFTVFGGVSERFSPPDGTDEGLFRHHHPDLVGRPFVLCVGGSDPRKNLERLVDALGILRGSGWRIPLLVPGHLTDAWSARLRRAATAAGLPDVAMRLLGPIADDHLVALYRRALLHVQPSLAEGLGLAVLDASPCGCPSLVSGTTALREVAGSPAATFDPTDARSIARALTQAEKDPARRAAVLASQAALLGKATWPGTAARVLAAVDEVVVDGAAGGSSPSPRRGRAATPALRVGLLGPLPPLGGGIGDYNARLAGALVRDGVAVDHLSARPSTTSPLTGVRRLHVRSLGRHIPAPSYDALVATLGNSDGHFATVAACLTHPTWLWLHEVRLPAIATAALAGDARSFSRLLDLAYPGRAPHHAAERAGWSTMGLLDAGVGLTWPLVQRSRGVLVNSEVARRLLLMDLPPGAARLPVHVLPPACPPVVRSRRTSARETEPILATFGVVATGKLPNLLLDAAALLGRPVRIAFVGSCPPVLEDTIRDRAAIRGLADRVIITGRVDDDAWRSWLDRTAVAVQLRETHSGETSAALLEALSAGLPTITNLPTAAELPQGTVRILEASAPESLAQAIEDVLADPAQQAELADAAMDFAGTHTVANLASVLRQVTTTLAEP